MHVALRLAGLAGEDGPATSRSPLRWPCGRRGWVTCASTWRRRARRHAVDEDEDVDVGALPWPDARRVARSGWRAARSSPSGRTPRRRPSAAPRRRRAVPRPLLARGARGRRGPARARRVAGRRRRRRRCWTRAWRGCSPTTRTGCRRARAGRRSCGASRSWRGGPGTGKTTTVARIVALVAEQARAAGAPPPLVALAAPTGKAAARLEEAVHEQAAALDVDDGDPRRAAGPARVDAAPAAGLAAGQPEPLPPRARQPAAARPRDRRRDVDGLAHAHVAARRGGPPRRAARARRRPGPAHVDRGRRGAGGHRGCRRRARGDRRARARAPLRARASRPSPRRSAAATRTPRSPRCARRRR